MDNRVRIVPAYLGEFSPLLGDGEFDIVFSVSVVEHVPTEKLADFHRDQMRILKPGGRFVHAIDIILQDGVSPYADMRCGHYREWLKSDGVEAAGPVLQGAVRFETSMASNTDYNMYLWGKVSEPLVEMGKKAQAVSLIVEGRRAV